MLEGGEGLGRPSNPASEIVEVKPVGILDEQTTYVPGFKSLAKSRIAPKFTRPVPDMIDGLW
ncbi:hypothetical protein NC653_017940 [Populus alba x Populus x berolinensis]|uniref:Uncharacterized protein n=1 Tax=Populus alba x Populus x berolinensis TaxID=444605 RepID=A0AAD6W154_9ROSI|nr:hypothetical protein NC653_017940 [Populus alba x Populus x berolinensis]